MCTMTPDGTLDNRRPAVETSRMLDWSETRTILEKHSFSRKTPAATPWQGWLLGNADMGASVFGPAHKLTFRMSKLDLWDARWNEENYKHPRPLSRFKEFVLEESKRLKHGESIDMSLDDSWQGKGTTYPCMRMGADLCVRVCMSQILSVPVEEELRLDDAVYEAQFVLGWWPKLKLAVKCETFISWHRNVLVMRITVPEQYKQSTVVSLFRDPYGGRSWELLSSGGSLGGKGKDNYRRDPRIGALPPAEITAAGHDARLWQVMPGDEHCPERGFSIAARSPQAEFLMEPSGHAALELLDHTEVTLFVAMCSEMEAPDSRKRAASLVDEAAALGWDALYAEHRDAWQEFWMESAIELDADELEQKWYRTQYAHACEARSGKPASALMGPRIVCDCPAWRGDRHNNFPELSSKFWGDYSSNHEKQARNYVEWVHGYLPTAQRIAKEIFECERGAFYPHCYIDGSDIYWFHFTWARSLFLPALHAQNCWWHYQYFGDRTLLKDVVYPIMRECARFYVELLKKNEPGDYTFYPTIATEVRGWTKNFEFNKNCIEDLAHIKFLMRAMLEASSVLDADRDERRSWQDILDHLPAYPTSTFDAGPEFVDFAGQDQRPVYNHAVPLAPLWPAEDPDVITDPVLRESMINTLGCNEWQDFRRVAIGLMKFNRTAEVQKTLIDEQKADRFLTNELLLRSWDGIVRVFPFWPLDKAARFRDLRAKGAFLVSAACSDGKIESVRIRSELGNALRVQAPWKNTEVVCLTEATTLDIKRSDGELQIPTQAGHEYGLKQGR